MELRTLYILKDRLVLFTYIQFPNRLMIQLYSEDEECYFILDEYYCILFSQPTILTVSNDSERFLKLVTFTMPNLVFYFYWGMSTFDGEIRNVFWKLRKLLQTLKDLNWLWENLKAFEYLWILVGQIGEKYKSWTTIKKVGDNLKDTTTLWLLLLLLSLRAPRIVFYLINGL